MLGRVLLLLVIVAATSHLASDRANSYELIGATWRTMPVTYCVNPAGMPAPNGQPLLTPEQFHQVIHQAFQTWQDLPTSSLRFIDAGLCAGDPNADWDQLSEVGWGKIRADAGGITYLKLSDEKYLRGGSGREIFEADIVINTNDQRMAQQGVENYVNKVLPYVVTHEVGHLIGLDHSAVACSVMVPRSINSLCQDDSDGAALLYP